MSKCSFDCFGPPGTLEPNTDIGGPGVLIGFMFTAWFVVVLLILHYFFASYSARDPFSTPPKKGGQPDSEHVWVPNRVDQLVLRAPRGLTIFLFGWWLMHPNVLRGSRWLSQKFFGWLHLRTWLAARERPRWEHAFTKVLLGMCDVQLLTGTGILLSGYISLSCFISAYHWQLVVYLVWFSNLTHIACLTALRRYLYQHQSERNWRLFFMTVLWAGLIPAMVPTVFFNWPHKEPTACQSASNARCFFDVKVRSDLFNSTAYFSHLDGSRSDGNDPADVLVEMNLADTSALQSTTVSILLLFFSYFTRTIKLTKRLSGKVRVTIRRWISDRFTKGLAIAINKTTTHSRRPSIPRASMIHIIYVKIGIPLYLVTKVYAELLTSDASDVYWLVVSAVWCTLRLKETRSSAEVNDNDWGFGQILPVFLLIGPIVTASLAVWPKKRSDEARNTPDQDFAQASNSVVSGDAPDNYAIQQQSDTASQHSSSHDSKLDASAAAQNARSSTDNAPTQPAIEAQSAQPEAQVNAQQSAGNDTPDAYQVGSEQAVDGTARTPRKITQEQLRAQLDAYYADGPFMGPVIAMACSQVLPMTVMIFYGMFLDKTNVQQLIIGFMLNVIVAQPGNTLVMVLWGFVESAESTVQSADGGSSRCWGLRDCLRILWHRGVSIMVPVVLIAVNVLSCLWALNIYFVVVSICPVVFSFGLLSWRECRKGQGRARTIPVVEAGHELEAV